MGGDFDDVRDFTDRLWVFSRHCPMILSSEVQLAIVYLHGISVIKHRNRRFYLSLLLVLS
jgi:hypothetical protein